MRQWFWFWVNQFFFNFYSLLYSYLQVTGDATLGLDNQENQTSSQILLHYTGNLCLIVSILLATRFDTNRKGENGSFIKSSQKELPLR